MGVMFDGILGDRTDPLMQEWVELDKKISERLFANKFAHEGHAKALRDNYYDSLRKSLYEYVKSLNDTALFADHIRWPQG